jgi:hypothetical protein
MTDLELNVYSLLFFQFIMGKAILLLLSYIDKIQRFVVLSVSL